MSRSAPLAAAALYFSACAAEPADKAPTDSVDEALDTAETWTEVEVEAGEGAKDDDDDTFEGGGPCPEDFDPDAPCEGTWETGAWCEQGADLWYCEDGAWQLK